MRRVPRGTRSTGCRQVQWHAARIGGAGEPVADDPRSAQRVGDSIASVATAWCTPRIPRTTGPPRNYVCATTTTASARGASHAGAASRPGAHAASTPAMGNPGLPLAGQRAGRSRPARSPPRPATRRVFHVEHSAYLGDQLRCAHAPPAPCGVFHVEPVGGDAVLAGRWPVAEPCSTWNSGALRTAGASRGSQAFAGTCSDTARPAPAPGTDTGRPTIGPPPGPGGRARPAAAR